MRVTTPVYRVVSMIVDRIPTKGSTSRKRTDMPPIIITRVLRSISFLLGSAVKVP